MPTPALSCFWVLCFARSLFLKLPFCLYFSAFTQRMVMSACNFSYSTLLISKLTVHGERHTASTAGQQLAKINMYGFGGFFPRLENCSKYYFIEKKCKWTAFILQKSNDPFLLLSVRKRFVVYCFFAGFENCSFAIIKLEHLFHSFAGLAIHATSQKWRSCQVCRKGSFTKWPFGKMSIGKSVSV